MLDIGVELALEHFGIRSRVLAYAERESYAAADLLARMEESSMEPAPIWCGDLAEFPCELYRGSVVAGVVGFPCPPVSCAGKGLGTEDERWILPDILDAFCRMGCDVVFLENVRGLLAAQSGDAFGEVQRLLAERGFHAEWTMLEAGEVGAGHERARVFILAYREGKRLTGWGVYEPEGRIHSADISGGNPELDHTELPERWPDPLSGGCGEQGIHGSGQAASGSGDGSQVLGDSDRQRQQQPHHTTGAIARGGACWAGCELANTECEPISAEQLKESREGLRRGARENNGSVSRVESATVANSDCRPDERRGGSSELGRTESAQSCEGDKWERDGNSTDDSSSDLADASHTGRTGRTSERRDDGEECATAQRDSGAPIFAPGPRDARWPDILREYPHLAPAIESGLCVLVDGVAVVLDEGRTDQLRCGGNGVVALQAAYAFINLISQLEN